jgi:hypothetical protein
MAKHTGNINMDWLSSWEYLHTSVISPVLMEARLPMFTSGFDVIARSRLLTDHLVFRQYLERSRILRAHIAYEHQHVASLPDNPLLSREEIAALWAAAVHTPLISFALPGQPVYRAVLGRSVPPPLVEFANFSARAPRMPGDMAAIMRGETVEDPVTTVGRLQERVRRFRHAERAVALGLPATAFDLA